VRPVLSPTTETFIRTSPQLTGGRFVTAGAAGLDIMADSTHPVQDPVIVDFKNMLRRCTLQAVCGRQYVLVEKLTKWLKGKRPGHPTSQAFHLLQAVYRSRNLDSPAPPISIERLCHPKTPSLLVFSILLHLDRGALVDCFARQGIIDARLPIDLLYLRKKLEALKSKELPDPVELADKFDRIQWRFYAPKLEFDMDSDYVENAILPINKWRRINDKGGTAEVFQIEVLEEFVGDELKEVVKSSGFNNPSDGLGYVSFREPIKTASSQFICNSMACTDHWLAIPIRPENIRRGPQT
jgi:hypothetical protein